MTWSARCLFTCQETHCWIINKPPPRYFSFELKRPSAKRSHVWFVYWLKNRQYFLDNFSSWWEKKCCRGFTLCNGVVSCYNALQKVELNSTSCNAYVEQQKILRNRPRYTSQFFYNLFRSGVARQVIGKMRVEQRLEAYFYIFLLLLLGSIFIYPFR